MAARNRCGAEADGLASEATAGVTPPLLPTLVVAVVLAAASFYCPEVGRTPAPGAAASQISSAPLPAETAEAADAAFVPASLAFPRQFPIAAAEHVGAAARQVALQAPPHRSPAPRIAASRRAAPAKGAQAPADNAAADNAFAAAVEPVAAAAPETEDGLLPALALPFAPTIRAATRAASFVGVQSAAAGAEAVALGGAMVDLVGRMR